MKGNPHTYAKLVAVLAVLTLSGCSAPPRPPVSEPERGIGVVSVPDTRATLAKYANGEGVERHALVVGVSRYRYADGRKLRNLRYAAKDAELFAAFLKSEAGGKFERVELLTDRKAKLSEIRRHVRDTFGPSQPQDLIVLFFSGHGAPDPHNPDNLYFLPYDAKVDNLAGTAWPMDLVEAEIRREAGANKVVIIADACHAAGAGSGRNMTDSMRRYMKQLGAAKAGWNWLFAARADEEAQEGNIFGVGGHGVFTYHLVHALRGKADRNADGFVSVDEAFDYTKDKVLRATHSSQTPEHSPNLARDIPLGIVGKRGPKPGETSVAEPDAGRVPPPTPPAEDVVDSATALKLANAAFRRNKLGDALDHVEPVITRHDAHECAARLMMLRIHLARRELADAEAQFVQIWARGSDADECKQAGDLIYEEYKGMANAARGQSAQLALWRKFVDNNPENPHVGETETGCKQLRADLRSAYERDLAAQLKLASSYAKRKDWSRASQAAQAAAGIVAKAGTQDRIDLDAKGLDGLKAQIETGARKDADYRLWAAAEKRVQAIDPKSPGDFDRQLSLLDAYVRANTRSDYRQTAQDLMGQIGQSKTRWVDVRYSAHMSDARTALAGEDFAKALEEAAQAIQLKPDEAEAQTLLARVKQRRLDKQAADAYASALARAARGIRPFEVTSRPASAEAALGEHKKATAAFAAATAAHRRFQQTYPGASFAKQSRAEITRIDARQEAFLELRTTQCVSAARDRLNARDHGQAATWLTAALVFRPDNGEAKQLQQTIIPVLVVTAHHASGRNGRAQLGLGERSSHALQRVTGPSATGESRPGGRSYQGTGQDIRADVYIDGRKVGVTPLRWQMQKGRRYDVRVVKARHRPWTQTVVAPVGGEKRFDLALEESKLPPGFDRAFILPTGTEDQHGNPVVARSGSQYDAKTGYPHEVWLRDPKMEFVLIPAGTFTMGSPSSESGRDSDEGPQHRVRITKPFYLAKYETTNGQYRGFKTGHSSKEYKGHSLNGEKQPVVYVSWNDATAFCKWLSGRSGAQVGLPTEAQWEYACRAGTSTVYYWGHKLDPAYCNFADKNTSFSWREEALDDGHGVTAPVGRYRPNAFGLHDMLGNVWEWCSDGKRSYSSPSQTDPCGSQGGSRVLRGGSWRNAPSYVRCAGRFDALPTYPDHRFGFRLLLFVPLER